MPHVTSEAIEELAYERRAGVLFVRFSSGEWYAYLDVPQAVYDAFLAAPSKGRFFQTEVRDRYAYERILR